MEYMDRLALYTLVRVLRVDCHVSMSEGEGEYRVL